MINKLFVHARWNDTWKYMAFSDWMLCLVSGCNLSVPSKIAKSKFWIGSDQETKQKRLIWFWESLNRKQKNIILCQGRWIFIFTYSVQTGSSGSPGDQLHILSKKPWLRTQTTEHTCFDGGVKPEHPEETHAHSTHKSHTPSQALNPESSRCDSANRCAAKVNSNNVSSLPPFARYNYYYWWRALSLDRNVHN